MLANDFAVLPSADTPSQSFKHPVSYRGRIVTYGHLPLSHVISIVGGGGGGGGGGVLAVQRLYFSQNKQIGKGEKEGRRIVP